MRRVIGLILVGLGAFLLILGVLARFYLPGQLVKFPLDQYIIANLHDPNGSYFSAAKLRVLNVPITATDTIQGDVAAGSRNTAVYNEFIATRDDTNGVNFDYFQRHAPFDRRTGLLKNCCGAFLNDGSGDRLVHLSGQGFYWPIGAEKKTYQLFDTTLDKPVPVKFAGTATVLGLQAYRYVEQVPPQQFGTQTLPGSLVGIKDQPSVTLPEFFQGTITYWVDPDTGGPLKVQENIMRTLRDSTGATRLVLFRANLQFTPDSVQRYVKSDRDGRDKQSLVTVKLPLVLVLVGLVLVAVGVALFLAGAREPRQPAAVEGFEPQDQGIAPH